MCDMQRKYFSPRLLDYIVITGSRHPNHNNHVSQTPELLRRYPLEDHKDFQLPIDVVFFCQPEGCISVGPKRMSLRETTSFVFTLTEKDSGITRYGICVNFFRPFEKQSYSSCDWQKSDRLNLCSMNSGDGGSLESEKPKSPRTKSRSRPAGRVRNNTLTSLCIISHHPFYSTFRECLFVLRRLIEACHDRSCTKRIGGSKGSARDTVWGVLTGQCSDNIPSLVMHEVREIETWILRLLSAPVPVPMKTRVEVSILPKDLQPPLLFALPDHTRFTLIDFPLHLPLELLGVETCLKVLTAVILEHKVVLQSRDYNALSMSVIAFVSMFYPLEYMFPVIPLLPTCMASAEQLLLAPTPFLIGVPASFFLYKKDFQLPDDIWLVDLDSNKIISPSTAEHLPPLPDPESTALKTHLKQIINAHTAENGLQEEMDASQVLYGTDTDCLDVAVRVAMVRFFNSPNILGNFCEHTRTMRLYPRPVVAFQLYSFLKSRPIKSHFTARLARTQSVEYFGEWSLSPLNVVYLRVQTGVYDPSLIGDKPKWYAQHLQPLEFKVYDENSTLGAALSSSLEMYSDEIPTDESGSDSEGAESTSSSYSSLSDFVTDMMNSEIDGESPAFYRENQVLAVDESKVFCPPSTLHVPENPATNSDSALSLPDSDLSSSDSSSPTYSQDAPKDTHSKDSENEDGQIFRYDSGHVSMIGQSISSRPGSTSSPDSLRKSPHPPNVQVIRTTDPHTTGFEPSEKSPAMLKPLTGNRSFSRNDRASNSSGGSSGSTRKTLKASSDRDSDRSSGSSIISTISNELTDMAQSATTTMSELFGSNKSTTQQQVNKGHSHHNAIANKPPAKQFTPLGPRKALVEKSGLVKHASSNKPEIRKQPSMDARSSSNSENQQFLKEVVKSVLEGQGVSWLKLNRIKKLMEDENYRNFIISRLNKNLDRKQPDDMPHMEDVCVNRTIFKGMLTIAKAICHGLEHTYQNHGLGGMASAFMLMEILHTHYWCREIIGGSNSNRSDSLTPDMASLHGSHESLASSKGDESMQKSSNVQSVSEEHGPAVIGSPVIVNGDEFENLEIPVMSDSSGHSDNSVGGTVRPVMDLNKNVGKPPLPVHQPVRTCDIIVTDLDESSVSARSGDMMHDMVRNKELLKSTRLDKFNSLDSEISEASTLVSTSSEKDDEHRKRSRINHHSIRSALSDSEMDSTGVMRFNKRNRSPSSWSAKSNLSVGYRYTDGKLINTALLQLKTTMAKTYLFEGMLGKDRSRLWDQLQFWEDLFLDAVAQERDIIGMDQRPSEMMERYRSLGNQERKRLEHDEDRLLSQMLYNLVGFMVMMNVNKNDTRRKVRRLLGKSHIGLLYSQDVNNLLDQINNLFGNDIDLRPLASRQMQKQSFTVHWGTDNSGDMLFMEVCDDCLLLRSVTGTIHDRWWFEKLVNMTYCPKTKVLCLWRKQGDKVQLNQFYTKKCRELYFCVKESMEKAASRNAGKLPGPELGGEFPVQDLKTGQGGLLQVCMEGIGLLLANSKLFIELTHIRKCFTLKGGIFVLEEFDSKTKQIVQHKYKSSMSNEAALMLHRIITVRWAKVGYMRKKKDENGNS